MKQFLRSGFLMTAACFASGSAAHAQIVLYSTDFPDDQGWVFHTINNNAWWDVDSTPGVIGFSTNSWVSAPFSLNFNNGFCYCTSAGQTVGGSATSPSFDLGSAAGSIVLQFWCNWDTEDNCAFDQRILAVQALGGGAGTQFCFNGDSCGPARQWHTHSIALEPSWGLVELFFFFGTSDWMFNDGAGWFIDDVSVVGECASTTGYCTSKLNSLGCSPTLFTTGTPSFNGLGSAFRIWAGNVLNQKIGLMLWSRATASTPFGGGTLCVAAPITRTAVQNSGGTSLPAQDCTGTYVLQFTPAMMTQAGLLVGDDVYSQYWSRDNGFPPPDNVGLTAGVHWEICP